MINLAVIGDPIAHSLSPMVHSVVLDALGVDYQYKKYQVKKGDIQKFIKIVKKEGISGFNVTMPHKIDILPFLESIDGEAIQFQSVNTVSVVDGKLYGYNTDAEGYRYSLAQCGYQFLGRRIVVLGAGGVARTIALKAAIEGAKEIHILSRRVSAAEEVVSLVQEKVNTTIFAAEMQKNTMCEKCKDADVLVNATPLGMEGVVDDFADFSFLDALPQQALVSDLIYRPAETKLIREAKKRGHQTLNGLGMLIFQAILADEIYLGTQVDKEKIFTEVYEKIKKEISQ